jgi:hypothetical protein
MQSSAASCQGAAGTPSRLKGGFWDFASNEHQTVGVLHLDVFPARCTSWWPHSARPGQINAP